MDKFRRIWKLEANLFYDGAPSIRQINKHKANNKFIDEPNLSIIVIQSIILHYDDQVFFFT